MSKISRRKFMSYSLAASGLYLLNPTGLVLGQNDCPPTRPDILGPFYRAGAPERNVIGEDNNLVGYGYVQSTLCEPLPGAKIEIWQASTDAAGAEYDYTGEDFNYYATLFADDKGYYEFYTDMPGIYVERPIRHIHYVVSAKGYQRLITQKYFSNPGTETKAPFDFYLIPQT
jgi:protocatechuate 3,4-dioxygenase beta subunit